MDKTHDPLYDFEMGRTVTDELLENAKSNGYGSSRNDHEVDEGMEAESLEVLTDEGSFEDMALLQDVARGHDLLPEEYARVVIVEAERIVKAEQERLNQYHNEHPEYSDAIRDWVFEGLRRKGIKPGQDLLELQGVVINELIGQLEDKQEDPEMIGFARTWLQETTASRNYKIARTDFRSFRLAA